MSKTKKIRLITIFALLFAAALAVVFAAAALPKAEPFAATYAPTSIFEAGTGGDVGTDKPETAEEGATYWVRFRLNDGGKVHFRRNLALKWYAAEPAEETPDSSEGSDSGEGSGETEEPEVTLPAGICHYFGMEFSFPAVNFETFTLSFDSAEENVTKKGVTTNALVFTKAEGGFDVEVHDSRYDPDETEEGTAPEKKHFAYTDGVHIAVSIDEAGCEPGDFAVYVAVGDGEKRSVGNFTNISGYYLEYRSVDSTTPSTPITFEAVLPESAADDAQQEVLMHELNLQTFEVDGEGMVKDNTPAVLVLNEKIYPIRLGQQFSLTYYVMDVMRSASASSRHYYMADAGFTKPNETNSDEEDKKAYNYKSLSSTSYFLPPTDDSESEEAFVVIRFTLTDSTHTNERVYLSWYADESAVINDQNGYDYIKVVPETSGPVYTGLDPIAPKEENEKGTNGFKDEANETLYNEAVSSYQTELTEAASKVSAGDGAYLYLPSLRGLISSEFADYRNLRFNFYYYKPNTADGGSATSATSLRYSNLRIEVDREGVYKLRVVASDAASNEMKYYDTDGNLVSLTSSNVWDIEGIPEFYFTIKYTGPSIEDAGTQDEGRREQTYSIDDFEIIALDGYEKEYFLYHIETDRITGYELPATYSALVDDLDSVVEKLTELDSAKGENDPKILREIKKYNSDVTEDDDEWDSTDNEYNWNPDSSLSFRPQETGYYLVKVLVTDSKIKTEEPAEKWMAIYVRTPIDRVPGQSKWLQNNTTSIVLFAIAAVLLIAVILLAVIRPTEKKVEEVDLKSLKGGKNGKKKE